MFAQPLQMFQAIIWNTQNPNLPHSYPNFISNLFKITILQTQPLRTNCLVFLYFLDETQ